jgi:hypothetical protein
MLREVKGVAGCGGWVGQRQEQLHRAPLQLQERTRMIPKQSHEKRRDAGLHKRQEDRMPVIMDLRQLRRRAKGRHTEEVHTFKMITQAGVEVHAFYPSTWEFEAGKLNDVRKTDYEIRSILSFCTKN